MQLRYGAADDQVDLIAEEEEACMAVGGAKTSTGLRLGSRQSHE